ncbi:hypothetical protein GOP47_0001520 [Adiantum capillus-veneris]|uniref:Uncharacterized protein n=1 Tax=Adiantum capillus-veneris TaxID=13818 RepID=A0A9D4VA80_ADICA|nr:hypothetical protein GOP47_0001520 [Adiantum capillus-veneris]
MIGHGLLLVGEWPKSKSLIKKEILQGGGHAESAICMGGGGVPGKRAGPRVERGVQVAVELGCEQAWRHLYRESAGLHEGKVVGGQGPCREAEGEAREKVAKGLKEINQRRRHHYENLWR